MQPLRRIRRIAVGIGLLFVAGLAFASLTFPTAVIGQGKKDAPRKPPPGRVNWNETKVAFDMRGKTWDATIKWFCQQAQMPLVGKYPAPAGTINFFNVNGPDGKPREYTLAEIFDVLNEMLMSEHKHILMRREATLMIYPADEPIDKLIIPRIEVSELPERGKTEIVEVVVKLRGELNAVEFAPQARRLLGVWGIVTPLEDTNQLIIQGTVDSLRRNLKHFMANPDDPRPAESAHTFAHKCIYLRASAAEALLRNALGQLSEPIVIKSAGAAPQGPADKTPAAKETKTVRITTITSDRPTNMVFISGPPAKIEQAKIVLKSADVARFVGDKGILIGPPLFRTHEVPQGNAEAMAKVLVDIFKDDNTIRILVKPPAQLLVYADPQTHLEIDRLNGEAPPPQKTELIALWRLDAGPFVDSLKEMFPESRNSAPYIGADRDSNSVRLRGTAEQIKAVREVISQLDGKAGSTRIFALDKASGATVADALEQLFPRVRDNPLMINLPGHGLEVKSPANPPNLERVPAPKSKMEVPQRK